MKEDYLLFLVNTYFKGKRKQVDVSLLIRHRLIELGLDQKDLAAAAQVTESYISQLLARKKAPPAPSRTDLYEKIGQFLQIPKGELSKLAELQRQLEMKKKLATTPEPLFQEQREVLLSKCESGSRTELSRIFEKDAFGELERLVTQKLLEVSEAELLDIVSWDIDLKTFAIEIVLKFPEVTKRFEFTEVALEKSFGIEPGFEQFLNDKSLSGDANETEIEFLKALRFESRCPTPLYYYRELQNLRDPLHFQTVSRSFSA